jgi:hypothetical protein
LGFKIDFPPAGRPAQLHTDNEAAFISIRLSLGTGHHPALDSARKFESKRL